MSAEGGNGRRVGEAMRFIRDVRADPALRAQLEPCNEDEPLTQALEFARARGYDIDAEALRSAHAIDWDMRWIHYRPRKAIA